MDLFVYLFKREHVFFTHPVLGEGIYINFGSRSQIHIHFIYLFIFFNKAHHSSARQFSEGKKVFTWNNVYPAQKVSEHAGISLV